MTSISIMTEPGLDIVRRVKSGELEIAGILLRSTRDKTFRYLLRGYENLPRDLTQLPSLPQLDALRNALGATQMLQIVSIAQNAAMAATLRRIERRLEDIDQRLKNVEQKLGRLDTKLDLVLAGMKSAPVTRLKAAKTAVVTALRDGERSAVILATLQGETAARDILEQAHHLVRVERNGLPFALLSPREHADLVSSSASAMEAVSAMLLAQNRSDAAAGLMREAADSIGAMRRRLSRCFTEAEFLIRRMDNGLASDKELLEAAAVLRETEHWCRGRAVMIEMGLTIPSPDGQELERVESYEGLGFSPITTSGSR